MTSILHIRCGSDIKDALTEGGVEGGFLEYADPDWRWTPSKELIAR